VAIVAHCNLRVETTRRLASRSGI